MLPQIIFHQLTTLAEDDLLGQLTSFMDDLNPLKNFDNIYDLIFAIFTFAYEFAGIICVAFLIYGGYQYLTSSGNEERIKAGQKTLTNAVIGLVIVLAAAVIVRSIKAVLKIE